jgi:hypothetical protein
MPHPNPPIDWTLPSRQAFRNPSRAMPRPLRARIAHRHRTSHTTHKVTIKTRGLATPVPSDPSNAPREEVPPGHRSDVTEVRYLPFDLNRPQAERLRRSMAEAVTTGNRDVTTRSSVASIQAPPDRRGTLVHGRTSKHRSTSAERQLRLACWSHSINNDTVPSARVCGSCLLVPARLLRSNRSRMKGRSTWTPTAMTTAWHQAL